MRRILLGLLLGLLLAAPTAWSVLRRDTLQATPHGYKLPSLVVTGTPVVSDSRPHIIRGLIGFVRGFGPITIVVALSARPINRA